MRRRFTDADFHCRFVAAIFELIFLFLFFCICFSSFEKLEAKKKMHASQLGERNKDWNSWILVKRVSLSILLCQKKKTRKKTRNAANCTGTRWVHNVSTEIASISFRITTTKSYHAHSPRCTARKFDSLYRDAAAAAYCYFGFALARNGYILIFSCSSQSPSAVNFVCLFFHESFHQLKFYDRERTEHEAKDLRLRWETTLDWTTVDCLLCDCRNCCLLLSHGFLFGERFRWRPTTTTTMRTIRWRCRGNRVLASLRPRCGNEPRWPASSCGRR